MSKNRELQELLYGVKGEKDHSKPLHRKSKDYPGTTITDWNAKGPHPRIDWEEESEKKTFYLCNCQHEKGDELPDYAADPRLVLREMMKRKEWIEFRWFIDDCWVDLIVLDTTGKLRDLAIEWLKSI